MPSRVRVTGLAVGSAAISVVGFALTATPAEACSPLQAAPFAAFPPAGANEVPPPTSIKILGSPTAQAEFELEANGQLVPLPQRELLGHGGVGFAVASFWRLPGVLSPSTTYVLRVRE